MEMAVHQEQTTKSESVVGGDYSGAAEKTDPVEIALVRKLDRMIMVGTCSEHWGKETGG